MTAVLTTATTTDATADPVVAVHRARHRPHALYLELMGKGGLWGVGYDFQLGKRLAFGGVASLFVIGGQRVTSLSPYLAATLVESRNQHHRWFVHAGPQIVQVSTPSPVPEWSGTSTTGIGAELSSGYEYRNRILVRVFAMGTAGKGGLAPWLGVSLGWTL